MSTPTRKGYRAAIEYAAQPETTAESRANVTLFLAWFYERPLTKIIDDVKRSQASMDEQMIAPHSGGSVTARMDAERFMLTKESRAVALREIEQIILSVEAQRHGDQFAATQYETAIAYWRAVRRIVERQLQWRVTP